MVGDGTGYAAKWRLFRVNRETWADASEVDVLESAHIITTSDERIQSGSLTVVTGVDDDFEDGYYRLSMAANGERYDIATLYCHSDSGETSRGRVRRDVTGVSVLEPANTQKLFNGEYAPAGSDGAAFVAELLRSCVYAPIEVLGSFVLESHVVFDTGETILQAAILVLEAGGFVMQIRGDGTIVIREKPTNPVLFLDRVGARLIAPASNYTKTTDIKNRYVAIEGASVAVAQNNDPRSITSLAYTGYLRDEVDRSPTRVNGENLQQYAERKLSELSVIKTSYTYTRDFVPDVYTNDVVRCSLPSFSLDGDMRITDSDLEIGASITVRETAETEVVTWPI